MLTEGGGCRGRAWAASFLILPDLFIPAGNEPGADKMLWGRMQAESLSFRAGWAWGYCHIRVFILY